jgi:hypothetical protein
VSEQHTQPLLFSLGELRPRLGAKAGTPEAGLDKYLARTIRRVTLFFSESEYSQVIDDLKTISKHLGTENNTDTIRRLLDEELKRYQANV